MGENKTIYTQISTTLDTQVHIHTASELKQHSDKTSPRLVTKLVLSSLKMRRPSRGRNNSKMSGSQQDYLVGESGSPQICLVVILTRFNKNNMTNTKFEKYS